MRDGWRDATLGEVADTLLGKTLARGGSSVEGGQPYLRNVNVQWGRVSDNALNEMIFSDAERELYKLKAGDILVCEGGEVGRLALLKEDLPGVYFQNAIHRVRASAGDEPGFIALALEHLVQSGGLEGLVRQVTIAHLNQRTLRQLPLALPPLDEQRRIVDLIAAVDDAVDAAEVEAGSLQSLLSQSMSMLIRNGPGRVRFADVVTLKRGFDLPVKDRVGGEVVVMSSSGAHGHHDVAMADGPGVVTGRSGTIGEVHLVNEPFWPLNTTLWVSDFHGNDPRYVRYLLQTMDLKRHAGGSTVPSLNRNVLSEIEVSMPDVPEQLVIVAQLRSMEDAAEAARLTAESLRTLRSNLLTVLLSGEHEIPSSYDALLGEVA